LCAVLNFAGKRRNIIAHEEYSAGVRFRIPALQECGNDSFFLYIKTNQIHNRGEGPHFFFPSISRHTITGITVRTGSTILSSKIDKIS
jgi:hypothetical protein